MEETTTITVRYLPVTIIVCFFAGLLVLNIIINIRILFNIYIANKKRCSCNYDIGNIKAIIAKWDRTIEKHESILNPIMKRKNEYVTTKDYETLKDVVNK